MNIKEEFNMIYDFLKKHLVEYGLTVKLEDIYFNSEDQIVVSGAKSSICEFDTVVIIQIVENCIVANYNPVTLKNIIDHYNYIKSLNIVGKIMFCDMVFSGNQTIFNSSVYLSLVYPSIKIENSQEEYLGYDKIYSFDENKIKSMMKKYIISSDNNI